MAEIAILGHGFLGASLVDGFIGPQHEIQVLCRTFPAHGATAGVNYVYGDAGDRTAIEAVIRAGLTVFAIGSTFPTLSSDQLQAFAARETDFPSPTSLYGQHKLSCEQFCLEQSQKLSLPLTILQLSNPYGPQNKRQ